jgi:thioredoxin 1
MSQQLKEIGDSDFESFISESKQPVVVDFWATWCIPCQHLGEIIEEVAENFKGEISFCKVNVNGNNRITTKYAVRNIPLLLFFENGKLIDRTAGAISKSLLEEKLNKLVKLV